TTLLGIDMGSSSIKAALLDAATGKAIGYAQFPQSTELTILAPRSGWAEQDPAIWWENFVNCCVELKKNHPEAWSGVAAIGIAYQMHGLVTVDREGNVLRPAIIWCDSRAVELGQNAAEKIGHQNCLASLLNLPGNFTAAKLAWVRQNEPELYRRIHKIMLP